MRFMSDNWSATKQRPHPQSAAETSRHPVSSGDRIRQCETTPGSCQKDTDQCPLVAISFCRHCSVLLRAKTAQERPLLPREAETRLTDCGFTH